MRTTLLVLLALTLAHAAPLSTKRISRTSGSVGYDPEQPADFVVVISNGCNTTMQLDPTSLNLWEGSFAYMPPSTISSQYSGEFKYGFEVQADPGECV
jgi:hypothetical protein